MLVDHKNDLTEFFNFNKEDKILYLGGRIDDDNLYPKEYCQYLNLKIRQLNPTIIICHNYVYAKKYYDKKILDEDMPIDIIIVYAPFILKDDTTNSMITKVDRNQRDIILEIKKRNESMKLLAYQLEVLRICVPVPVIKKYRFSNSNLKFYSQRKNKNLRKNIPKEPLDITKKDYKTVTGYNSTDGFWWLCYIINNFHENYKNLNVIGFTAFEDKDEDKYLSLYTSKYYKGQHFNNVKTSENVHLEREIKYTWCKNNIINNLENKEELMKYIQPI